MLLMKFEEEQAPAICRGVKRHFPVLAQSPLEALPTPFGVHVRARAPTGTDIAGAVSWASDNAHYSGLASHLQKH